MKIKWHHCSRNCFGPTFTQSRCNTDWVAQSLVWLRLECLQELDIVPGSNHPCFENISLNIYLLVRQPACVASCPSPRSIPAPCGLSQEVAGGSDVPVAFLGTEDMPQYNHRKQWKQQRMGNVDALPATFTLMLFSILSLLVEFWDHWCIREQSPSVTTAPSSLFPSALSS